MRETLSFVRYPRHHGPQILDCGVIFNFWAPTADAVELLQDGVAPKLMSRERDGWYQLLSRRAARQADPTAFDLKGLGGLIEERATDET